MDDSRTQALSIISSTKKSSHLNQANADSREHEETSVEPRRALASSSSSSMSKVGSSLRSLALKTIPDRLLSPKIIADEIRRLRRHPETTIFQRHREGSNGVSDGDKETLKALCMSLLLFRERKSSYETRSAALNEFTTLGIDDPLVRTLFQQCIIEANSARKHAIALTPDLPGFNSQHIRWSDFLGGRIFDTDDEKTLVMSYEILKNSLVKRKSQSLPSYSTGYLGSVYLSHALLMDVKDRELEFLLRLWQYFLHALSMDSHHGGWEVLDTAISNIISSKKRMNDFIKPSQFVGRFAVYLIWNADKTPTLYRIFFSAPRLHYSPGNKEQDRVSISYPPMEHWSIPLVIAYAMTITNSVISSTLFKEVHSLESLQGYARRAQVGTTLANSVLCDETWMAFYTVLQHAVNCYRLNHGIHFAEGLPIPVQSCILTLALWKLKSGNEQPNRALADLISQLFNIDHYLRDVLSNSCGFLLPDILTPLPSREERAHCLQRYTSIPLFENVPYLRRFLINGTYFFASDNLPFPPRFFEVPRRGMTRPSSVDTMSLDGLVVTWLFIGKGNFTRIPVLTAGHYPISAGHNYQGKRLYVAAARRDHNWYFASVEQCKSVAHFVDEFGESFFATEYFVLALRHSPDDLRAIYPILPKGAKSRTGPLYWQHFWPWIEGKTVKSSSEDDRRLKGFLDAEYMRCLLEDEILSGFD